MSFFLIAISFFLKIFFFLFSPRAIALGSSAIVKVSGQNCFRTLYGSLGQIRLGPPKASAEGSTKVPPRLHQGSTKVSPRLRKFRDLCGLLGQIRFGVPKGSVEGSPITSFNLSPSSSTFFSPTALALGPSAIVKVLGKNDTFVFWGSLQQMAFASQKVLWSVPQTVFYIGLTDSSGFLGNWLLLQKRFCGGFRQLFFAFVSQMAVAS